MGFFKSSSTQISWWLVVGRPPVPAGDIGSNPGSGRSHTRQSNQARAPELQSLQAAATEAHTPQSLSSATRGPCSEPACPG